MRAHKKDPFPELTPRDREVIRLAARGVHRDVIAEGIGVSRSDVNRRIRFAFQQTGARNGTHLVAILMAHGVITPADILDTDGDTPMSIPIPAPRRPDDAPRPPQQPRGDR